MGACLSSSGSGNASTDEKASAAIDRQLEEDARRLKKECKILLLGSGESGKTTIVKQMKIIHQTGYSHEERLMFRTTIFKNILDGSKAICEALEKLEIEIGHDETMVSRHPCIFDMLEHSGNIVPSLCTCCDSYTVCRIKLLTIL